MVGMGKGERRLRRNGDGHIIRCVIVLIRFPRCGLSVDGAAGSTLTVESVSVPTLRCNMS